jgi:hypothetical protein
MFYTVVKSTSNYGCEIWTVDCRLKQKLLSAEMVFGEELQKRPKY